MLLQPISGFIICRDDRLGLNEWNKNSGIAHAHMHVSTLTYMHTNARAQPPLAPCPPGCKCRGLSLLKCRIHCMYTVCCQQTLWETSLPSNWRPLWKDVENKQEFTSSVSPLCLKILWPKLPKMSKTWHPSSFPVVMWYFIIFIICGWRNRHIILSLERKTLDFS